MGFLDKLFGHSDPQPQPAYGSGNTGAFGVQPQGAMQPQGTMQPQAGYNQTPNVNRPQNADEQAIARYRYMLQTAPPEDVERAHEEAFARLTPEQRQMVLQQLSQSVSPAEAQRLSSDPRSLAQATTRAEIRQPGFIERTFGGQQQQGGYAPQMGGGMMGGGGGMMGGMGGMIAGGLLSSMAGSFIGSSIANSFFSHHGNEQAFQSSPQAADVQGGVSDYNATDYSDTNNYYGDGAGNAGLDASADPYGDPADTGGFENTDYTGQGNGGLDASADPYGDPADAGGFQDTGFDSGGFDSGGGDFGGGDMGGGDF